MFETLAEAALEIRRDLAKSPLVDSSRVQQFSVEGEAREALNYSYTILKFPETVTPFIEEVRQLGFWESEFGSPSFPIELKNWLKLEEHVRSTWVPGAKTEVLHHELEKVLEGSEPSYAYSDRLFGALETLTALLLHSPDTRRGFWPIFHPQDAVRSVRETRIPCSLGYQVLIRRVGEDEYLHLTYLERSCDFDRFWVTDLWLARQFQIELCARLNHERAVPLLLGHLSHHVLSLHSFIDEEIY